MIVMGAANDLPVPHAIMNEVLRPANHAGLMLNAYRHSHTQVVPANREILLRLLGDTSRMKDSVLPYFLIVDPH